MEWVWLFCFKYYEIVEIVRIGRVVDKVGVFIKIVEFRLVIINFIFLILYKDVLSRVFWFNYKNVFNN